VVDLAIAQDVEAAGLRLRLATVEVELRKSRALIEQNTKDVNTMYSYDTRYAECLRSLSRALQPMVDGLCRLTRTQGKEEEMTEVCEARELECQAKSLTEMLTAVERRSHSISMVLRETKFQPAVPKVRLSLLTPATLQGLSRQPQQHQQQQQQQGESSAPAGTSVQRRCASLRRRTSCRRSHLQRLPTCGPLPVDGKVELRPLVRWTRKMTPRGPARPWGRVAGVEKASVA
jgi:hypothetical protein